MTKAPLVCIAGLILSLPCGAVGQVATIDVLRVRSTSKPVPAGTLGSLEIGFAIREGFKIPKKPSPKMQIVPHPEFEVKGDLNFEEEEQSKDPEYFSKIRSLNLEFRPAPGTEPGKYSLSGKLVYFYCSEKDKYCSRAVENIEIPIEVAAKK